MKLSSINTGHFKLDGGAMFGVVPKSIWNKLNPSDENNLCSWALRCLLVQDGERKILIDTGIGNKQDAKFFSHYDLHGDDSLTRSLAAHDLTPGDITDVILTHLHFDHCGGAINKEGDKLIPAFPNATYWSNESHWQWATHPNDREKASFLKENILPIQESGQLKFITGISQSTAPHPENPSNPLTVLSFSSNIEILLVGGHTRDMMLPKIKVKDRTVVFMADLLPSATHIPLPYVMAYDMFPLTTLTEKKAFLDEAVANSYVLFFEHDPKTICCSVSKDEKGKYSVIPVDWNTIGD